MAELTIQRDHQLGLDQARKLALAWTQQAERDFGLTCSHEQVEAGDQVLFGRTGVSGNLLVTEQRFELKLKLGFLLGAFKDQIEAEIQKNLNQLLVTGNVLDQTPKVSGDRNQLNEKTSP